MTKDLHLIKQPDRRLGRLVRTALLLLIGMIVLPVAAQFNGSDNYIFISGQVFNDVNGAPIADHDIYIISDSAANNGFQHYAMVKTDVNGFYRDTIITHLIDGSINIYLYDFYNNKEEKVNFYRFNWSDKYQMIVDFEIHDPYATSNLQANFKAEKDTITGSDLSVIFRDMTYGYKVKSWSWDFGDSTYSTVQDPTHIYKEPGIYLVKLTVCSYPPEFEYYLTSTIVKQVQVGGRQYYTLAGNVLGGLYPPIDIGLVYLYQITDDQDFIPIDTTEVIDSLDGVYFFPSLIEGKYTTKVRLSEESAFYGQYIPTYLGNTLLWDQAEKVTLDKNNFDCDINLIQSVGIPAGKGQIVGTMMYDTSMVNNPLVPAEDVEVVLLGVEGAHITCKMSDLLGGFTFADLAYGTYQLYPDVAGVQTSTMYITISEDKPVAEDFSLVITQQEVTYLGIGENPSPVSKINGIYPNPAHDQIRMTVDMKQASPVQVLITDVSGRCVMQESNYLNVGNTQLVIDISSLRSGYYQVIVTPEGKSGSCGKFIKIN